MGGHHRCFRKAFEHVVDTPTCGTGVAVEVRGDPTQPLAEAFVAESVQIECGSADHGHRWRQAIEQLLQVAPEPDAPLCGFLVLGDAGRLANATARANRGSRILDTEALADGPETCQYFGTGKLARQVRTRAGHALPRASPVRARRTGRRRASTARRPLRGVHLPN